MKWPFQRRAPIVFPGVLPGHAVKAAGQGRGRAAASTAASLRDRLRRTFDQVAIRKDSATAWNLAGGQVGLGQLPERLSIPRPRP